MYECPKCGALITDARSRYGKIPFVCPCEWIKQETAVNWDETMDGNRLRARLMVGLRQQHGVDLSSKCAEPFAQFPESRFWYDEPETVTLG